MQSSVSKERYKHSWKAGGVSATRYQRACIDAYKSTKSEDINMHVDYWHPKENGERDGVDVKGNNLPDEIWVEFRNVRGDLGWLLGEAKWIAFEMPEVNGFIRVERKDLYLWCRKNIDFKDYVLLKEDAYRRIYQRIGRQDKISKLTIKDLQDLKSYTVVPYSCEFIHPETDNREVIFVP